MTHAHLHQEHGDTAVHRDGAAGALDDLLDLDGEALHGYWSDAFAWVRQAADRQPRRRVLDLGAGTGTGTLGLAQRFGAAEVIAVDVSAASLARIRERALDLGLAGRVRTVEADVDAGLPDLGPLDVIWSSNAMHHFADPAGTLRELRAATRAGGLLAVAEFEQPLRFLPDDLGLGRPGFERRLLDVQAQLHREAMPTLGTSWTSRIASAGWTVVDERAFTVDLTEPVTDTARRYTHTWFARLAGHLEQSLDADDRAVLRALLGDGPQSALRRRDLHLRGIRTVTLARH